MGQVNRVLTSKTVIGKGFGGICLLAISGMLMLTGCWSMAGIRVEEIEKQPELREKATPIGVEDFFGRRMLNRPRKALVGNWMILFEDDSDVYLGFPRFGGIFDDRREVDELFRTPIKALNQNFPGWKEIDGEALQKSLRQALGSQPQSWQAKLEKDCLRVTGTLVAEPANQTRPPAASGPFDLCFDKRSLAVKK